MLGVSPSAYRDASKIRGPQNAAAVIACIIERAGHIKNAGGYLRDLTRKAARAEFSLGPMLMALMRANGALAPQGFVASARSLRQCRWFPGVQSSLTEPRAEYRRSSLGTEVSS